MGSSQCASSGGKSDSKGGPQSDSVHGVWTCVFGGLSESKGASAIPMESEGAWGVNVWVWGDCLRAKGCPRSRWKTKAHGVRTHTGVRSPQLSHTNDTEWPQLSQNEAILWGIFWPSLYEVQGLYRTIGGYLQSRLLSLVTTRKGAHLGNECTITRVRGNVGNGEVVAACAAWNVIAVLKE